MVIRAAHVLHAVVQLLRDVRPTEMLKRVREVVQLVRVMTVVVQGVFQIRKRLLDIVNPAFVLVTVFTVVQGNPLRFKIRTLSAPVYYLKLIIVQYTEKSTNNKPVDFINTQIEFRITKRAGGAEACSRRTSLS
jgi:hypothetical protein